MVYCVDARVNAETVRNDEVLTSSGSMSEIGSFTGERTGTTAFLSTGRNYDLAPVNGRGEFRERTSCAFS